MDVRLGKSWARGSVSQRLSSVFEQSPGMAMTEPYFYGVVHFHQRGPRREHCQSMLVLFSHHKCHNLNVTCAKREPSKNNLDTLSKYEGKF